MEEPEEEVVDEEDDAISKQPPEDVVDEVEGEAGWANTELDLGFGG